MLLEIVELRRKFMKNVIMILYVSNFEFLPLPPPYYEDIRDYKHANTEKIQKAILLFDWQKVFKNKNINEMTRILTDFLSNIFKKFTPYKTKIFDCKYPEWMNSLIISSLKKRTKYTKRFCENPSDYNKDLLNNQANKCTRLIIQAKEKYIAKMSGKLDNPNTAPKTYWSIISRFLNKKNASHTTYSC